MQISRPDVTDIQFNLSADDARFDAAVGAVLDDAFGPGRFAKVSERVREAAVLDRGLSRVALVDAKPVGCCRLYRIQLGEAPALFLGPLAVARAHQGASVGQSMVAAALEACDALGDLPILVVGQPAMFSPFGFQPTPRDTIFLPGPVELRRLQWRARNNTAPAGVVRAPRGAS